MDQDEAASRPMLVAGYQDEAMENDVAVSLQTVKPEGFEYVVTALPHTAASLTTTNIAVRTDMTVVEAKWWRTSVVGLCPESLSNWGHYLPWAWHMNLPAVILPRHDNSSVTDESLEEYASQLSTLALQCAEEAPSSFQLWVPVPLESAAVSQWQELIATSNYPSCVGILLDFVLIQVDSVKESIEEQLGLLHNLVGAGPILGFRIRTSLFRLNPAGYPTLSKGHQYLLQILLQRIGRTVKILLWNDNGATNRNECLKYLEHIRNRDEIKGVLDTQGAQEETDYLDELQKPLQPLQDHLVFATYEVFEGDPIKYQRYREAAKAFLEQRTPGSTTAVMVVGAGRGPLVTAVLNAHQEIKPATTTLRVVAVEKNPSAYLYLQSKQQSDPLWVEYAVQILKSDLRSLDQEFCKKADLIVSELLGSFGCNEVSPECLNPLLERCRPDVVSIPNRYTSFLAPASSVWLHKKVSEQAFYPHKDGVVGSQRAFETPYVVRTHAVSQLQTEQSCWSFDHPTLVDGTSRKATLVFPSADRGAISRGSGYGAEVHYKLESRSKAPWIVTGLLGTFSADLYDTSTISIVPADFSVGMFSWFPLYFPLHRPLHVPEHGSIRVCIWRKLDSTRVWYEWSVAVLDAQGVLLSVSPIHNPKGRSSHVSL